MENLVKHQKVSKYYEHDCSILIVRNGNTRTICKISSNLTVKTSGRPQCLRSGVFIVKFELVSRIVPILPLLTLNMQMLAGL